jgi:hypothetical protein
MSVGARGSDGVAEIEYLDEDGQAIGTYEVEYETEDGNVVDIVADFDEKSGDFDVTEEAAEAEDVDTALLSALEDDLVNDGGSEDSAGDSGDTSSDGAADGSGDGSDGAADGSGDGSDGAADGSGDGSGDSSTNDEPIVEEEAAPEAAGPEEE